MWSGKDIGPNAEVFCQLALKHGEGIGKINSGMITDKNEFRPACPDFFSERNHAGKITVEKLFDKLHH